MSAFEFTAPRHEYGSGFSWSRKVAVGGVPYIVGVERGRRVRIAFKPRGPGGWGYKWRGFVRDDRGREVWRAYVGKSLGARGLLQHAGLIPCNNDPGAT